MRTMVYRRMKTHELNFYVAIDRRWIGSYFLLIAVVFLIGCGQLSEEERQIRRDFPSIPSDMPVKDLGVVEFVSGSSREFEVDSNKQLSVTATEMDDGQMEVKFDYQSTSGNPNGWHYERFTQCSQFRLRSGMRCAPKMGDDVAVVIRPVIVASLSIQTPQ